MLRILHIVGARPNFIKVAPIVRRMSKFPQQFQQTLVHTGQHYDSHMSKVFFEELDLPFPDTNLEVGSGSHSWQTAQIMLKFEPVIKKNAPDWLIVVGDVNSTLACALVAKKLNVKIAHVEAGLRSFDWTMPEETNRVLTDHLSDLLFVTEPSAIANLKKEGIDSGTIHHVGNVMMDSLVRLLPKAERHWKSLPSKLDLDPKLLNPGKYILVTLHRPPTVDHQEAFDEIMTAVSEINKGLPVFFPVHPRTQNAVNRCVPLHAQNKSVHLLSPLGYLDFLALMQKAALVITDSGGVQEETTFLGIPCLTVRPNTERPITIESGTNQLVQNDKKAVLRSVRAILDTAKHSSHPAPDLWDGRAAERIVRILADLARKQ